MLTVRGKQHPFSTHERMFLWNVKVYETENVSAWGGLEPPNLRIHAECSKHLSNQGQTFAAQCFWILVMAV